jgi:microcystin-dependent protein
MPGTTPKLALPYPIPNDIVDVPRDVKALADKVDATVASVPVGSLLMWPTSTPPAGFLVCNGAVVPVASYPLLDAVLGSVGGNITLPDFTDRFPAAPGTDNGALNVLGGESRHALSAAESGVPAHTHPDGTLAVASHGHNIGGGTAKVPTNTVGFTRVNVQHGSGSFNNNFVAYAGAGTDGNDTAVDSVAPDVVNATGPNTAAAAASSHENRPKFRTINFIIRAL